jgi:hypothetical protein
MRLHGAQHYIAKAAGTSEMSDVTRVTGRYTACGSRGNRYEVNVPGSMDSSVTLFTALPLGFKAESRILHVSSQAKGDISVHLYSAR